MKWNNKSTTTDVGRHTENLACNYLKLQKLTLLESNFHSKHGEIDLIMFDNKCYVFIEVKYRKNDSFGGGFAAVNTAKQNKIKRCAQSYLQQKKLNEFNTECRFDIITLIGSLETPKITWIKNAF